MKRATSTPIDPDLLRATGFRIEGPDEAGRYWWTLYRTGWSGIECGPYRRSHDAAQGSAWRAMLDDEDIDWDDMSLPGKAVTPP